MTRTKQKCSAWAIFLGVLIFGISPAFSQQANQNVPPGQQQKQIQTLAVVNGQPISRQQIANECMRRFGEKVLQGIINKQLVLNECQRIGVNITEKDVNDEIISRAKKFGMSGERFIQLICSRRNITPDRYKEDEIWSELALRRLAANNLTVTEEEIAERMEFEFGPKVQVREIAVDSRALAEKLLAEAQTNPAEFGRLAKDYSVDPNSASVRGLLPPIRRNSGLPQFENVAFALQPNQISDIFQLEDKFIILKCERMFPAMELPADQVAGARERITEELSNAKLGSTATQIFRSLQERVKIVNVMNDERLAKELPGVAAMVDQTKISKRYLAEECISRFGTGMLDTEINRAVLSQALRQNSMQVAEADVTAEISRAAESFGHVNPDGSINVENWLKFVTEDDLSKVDFYIEDEVWPSVALKKLVEQSVSVSEEDMQKGFEANFGPRVEVLAIVSNEHRNALKVWQMASANPTQEHFGKLANQYSVEPASKANFGQVPPIQRHGGRPELEKEAFSLKPNELSKVVQVGKHWVIMYCQGHTTPHVTDFDAVKDELHKNIHEKKMRLAMSEQFEQLRSQAQIDNFMAGTSQTGAKMVQAARKTETSGPANQQRRNGNLPFRNQK